MWKYTLLVRCKLPCLSPSSTRPCPKNENDQGRTITSSSNPASLWSWFLKHFQVLSLSTLLRLGMDARICLLRKVAPNDIRIGS